MENGNIYNAVQALNSEIEKQAQRQPKEIAPPEYVASYNYYLLTSKQRYPKNFAIQGIFEIKRQINYGDFAVSTGRLQNALMDFTTRHFYFCLHLSGY